MNTEIENMPLLLKRGIAKAQNKDLPNPLKLSMLLGPGVIMVATAIGSGEIFFWPGITMKHGFMYLWPALLSVYLQHILNTEFARYTLATGETAITGFARLWKPFAWIFLICATLPWVWPGWGMGAATVISWVVPVKAEIIAVIMLVLIGIALSTSRSVYKAVEFLQLTLTVFIILVVIFFVFIFVKGETLTAFGQGLVSFPTSIPSDIKLAAFISALAFCGAGGSINLATSNWVRDKGFGMGKYVPKVLSPITGEPVSKTTDGFYFTGTDENKNKWKQWWKLINKEQSVTFLLIGTAGLVLLMLLAHSLLIGQNMEIGMGVIKQEGNIIGARLSNIGVIIFNLMVFAVFFTTALGVLDHVARVTADILKNNILTIRKSASKYSSESALYFYVLWGMITFALIIILGANITSTPTLLSTAGALSGVVMFLYSVLILILNLKLAKQFENFDSRFKTGNPFQIGIWRKIMLLLSILFYGGLSYLIVSETIKNLVK